MNEIEIVSSMSNREFLDKFARPGRVGLAGGPTISSRMIQFAERHVDQQKQASLWSHAFIFEGRRADGHHWIVESDMEIHRRNVRLGVQENRIEKLCDEKIYSSLAILDFDLTPEQSTSLIGEGLEMVATRYRYSLRELVGALVALRHPEQRESDNVLAREKSLFCSAFVLHVFRQIGIDLAPGVNEKHTTPEDISRTPVAHATYLLRHESKPRPIREKMQQLRQAAKAKGRKRIEKVRTALAARRITAAPRPD